MLFIVLEVGGRRVPASDEFGVDDDILTQTSSDMAACQCGPVSKERRHHLSSPPLPARRTIDVL